VITIKQSNKVPTANAGIDQSVDELTLITLDGTASTDPDNDAMTYLWTAPAGITLSSATSSKPTFTAPEVTVNTDYTFTLVVNDGTVSSTADQILVQVRQINKIPIANAGIDQSVNEGAVVTLDGSASSDPDGSIFTYLWTAPAGITLSSNTASKPTFTAPEVATNTNYTFTLIVNDGTVSSTANQVVVQVKQVNKIPIANAGIDQSVNEGLLVTLDGSASSDPDGSSITYLWTAPAGITLSSNTTSKPTFTAPEVTVNTNYTFTLVVNDGTVSSTADQIIVQVKQVNKVPTANAGIDQSVNEGVLVTLDGSASSDPDGSTITYLWTAPAGITLSSNTSSKPTFTAPEVTVNTNYSFTLVVNDGTVSSIADQVIVLVKQVNKAPVANAGIDQSLDEGVIITLDGSASSDPDGSTITYLWTVPAGITLSSNTTSKPTFTAPEVLVNTNYTFTLVVNDGTVSSIADQVVVQVKQVNKAPVANAGIDQSVNEGVLVTLDGTASSDADGSTITYLWTAPAGITLSSNTTSKPTFTAPEVTVNTNYSFTLVVNDGTANSIADQIVVQVMQVNKAPTANAGIDQSVNEGDIATLDGSASSDPDGNSLSYLWTAPAGITLSSNTTSKPTFTAPEVASNTNYSFTLLVNDGTVSSTTDQVVVQVRQVNRTPIANAGIDQSVNENNLFTLDGSASSDPEGNSMTYLWTPPAGITLSSTTTARPTFMAPEVLINTTYTFTLVVNDGFIDSPSDQVVINVKQSNKAPTANAGADQSADELTAITLDGSTSTDPDNDALTYLWTAPTGITLNSATASKPTFTAPEVATNTNYAFTLVVNDGTVSSSADQVIVQVKQVNKAPVANAGINQSVNENNVFTLDGSASSDPDGNSLTYLWSAPAGITLNSNTLARPTFTSPEVLVNTNYTFTLVVNDGVLNSPVDQIVITVKQSNKVPAANAGVDQSADELTLVTLDGSASTDPDNDALTYLWIAPAGITLSSATESKPTFTTPEITTNTNYTFTLVVNDGTVNSTPDQIVVQVKQVNKIPIANAGSDQSVNEGVLATLDGSASSDPDGSAITYLWTAPAGITLSSTTASRPTFTAPEVTVNTNYSFTLVVNDGTASSTTDQITIQVKQVNKAPVASAGTDQSINEGVLGTLDGSASSDPDGSIITYLWTAPVGITLSSTTALKPTFTVPEVAVNTNYIFTLVVNDGTVSSATDQIIVQVKQVNKAPLANAGSDQSVNEGVLVTLDGTASSDPDGSTISYLWTVPAGITLSSNATSKPTFTAPEVATNKNYTFTLVVNDGTLSSTADQIVVQVKHVNKVPVANAGLDQSVSQKQYVILNGILSSDADGTQLSYHWLAPAEITLINPNTATPSFEAPSVLIDTDFSFKLKVNDGITDSQEDEVIIQVLSNQLPVANAGINQSFNQSVLALLDGSASSDPNNKGITYLWTAPAGIVLSSNTESNPTFTTPSVSINTQYTFKLIVSNGFFFSTPDFVIITVKNKNNIPISNAGTDQIVDEGKLIVLDGSGSADPDNDALTYFWTAPRGIILDSPTHAKPSFTAPMVEYDDEYKFSLTVFDGTAYSVADDVVIKVRQVNAPPTANSGPDQSLDEGSLVALDGSTSSDNDGNIITYLWIAPPEIILSSTTAEKPSFIAPEVNGNTNYTIMLVVNDGIVNSTADPVIIQVKQVNKAPFSNAGSNQTINENSPFTLDGSSSSDPDNDVLTYQWTAPDGILLSSATAANPTFTTPEVDFDSYFTFSLVVNDGQINSPVDKVIFKVLQVNKLPFANAGADQIQKRQTLVTLDGSGSFDPDFNAITYLWTAPAGITLSSTISSKPTFTAPEVATDTNYTFSLVVNDGTANSAADQIVVVIKADHAPYVKSIIEAVSVEKKAPDQIIDLSAFFADDDQDDVLFYSVESNSNSTIVQTQIIGSNLILSFSTDNTGFSEITVTASSNGKAANSTFQVEVKFPTGIDLENEINEVQLYPNPTKGNVLLKFSVLPENGTWISVFDSLGKMITRSPATSKEEFLNLTGHRPGLYLVRIGEKTIKTYKLVLE
jgi:uncharacterized protein YggL (DUF469 family)